MRVVTVPILEDNYAYLVICEETQTAAAVDPADAKAVVAAAAHEGVTISHVLTTHCHWDHAGGNKDMVLSRSPSSFLFSFRVFLLPSNHAVTFLAVAETYR
jgi:glyoxylase-like metal-dependent hydrolase (beta-lactamase superfamily II)